MRNADIEKLVDNGILLITSSFEDKPGNMTPKDQQKLLEAGFTIIKAVHGTENALSAQTGSCLKGGCIKAKTPGNHAWHVLEDNFQSNRQLKERMHSLLKDHMTIEVKDQANPNAEPIKEAELWG